ncbi:histone h2a [Plakobranchus ocellatus]|uniref:Histone H2A n=1 Tax=Plakobranchus ocellatus TaxID=259542 RepID=A0AAV3YEZ8_9GAST|nr:histone h2a [Plakobranchus ocellatus]
MSVALLDKGKGMPLRDQHNSIDRCRVKHKASLVTQIIRLTYLWVAHSNCDISPSTEILELAGNAAKEFKKGRITPRHILLAIANDEELHQLLKHVTIAQGGVVPKIHAALVGPSRGKKGAAAAAAIPAITGCSPMSPSKLKAATNITAKKLKAALAANASSLAKAAPFKEGQARCLARFRSTAPLSYAAGLARHLPTCLGPISAKLSKNCCITVGSKAISLADDFSSGKLRQ